MSDSKHTPTPWGYGRSSRQIYGNDGHHIADIHLRPLPFQADIDEARANAAIIVEAVNNYDDLKHDIERHIGIASSQAEEIESLKARNAELVKALNEAIETIKIWHGFDEPKDMREGSWQIYLKHSPEMKRITAALANENEST